MTRRVTPRVLDVDGEGRVRDSSCDPTRARRRWLRIVRNHTTRCRATRARTASSASVREIASPTTAMGRFDFREWRIALDASAPKLASSVDLLLAMSFMKANDIDGFRRALTSARRRGRTTDERREIVSMKFNTLSGRNLTALVEAVRTKKVAFVDVLLHEFDVDERVRVNGKNVIEIALESENFELFEVLISARLRERLSVKQTLEDFVRDVAPTASERFAAWRERTAGIDRARGATVIRRSQRRSLIQSNATTLSYDTAVEVSSVHTFAYEPATSSSSVAQSQSPEVTSPQRTTTGAVEDEAESSGHSEHELNFIMLIMQKIPAYELEVMRIEDGDEREAERLHDGAVSRLLEIQHCLEDFQLELDGLFDGDAEQTPELVHRYRKRALSRLATVSESIRALIEKLAPTSPDDATSLDP